MLEFKKLGKKVDILKEYIGQSEVSFCDISLGVKYAWCDEYVIDYAIFNDTLILREKTENYQEAFYYPMGKDVIGALKQIENYCNKNHKPLCFCYIDDQKVEEFSRRYFCVSVKYDRAWSDYIYQAEKFKTYSGKKFGGQRNHLNKFKKLYPNYKFKVLESADLNKAKEFLDEFSSSTQFLGANEKVEHEKAYQLIENAAALNQVCGYIEVDGRVVALSVGEVVGETLIVHVEKALKKYDGVYPTMAHEFAKAFANDGVKFINREEDCGDEGLRTSKLQYNPIQIKSKNFVTVSTAFDKIDKNLSISTKRLNVSAICKGDIEEYAKLYLDDNLNKLWGYDYREDLNGQEPTPQYFYAFQSKLKDVKEEFSFAVRLNGKMIGELVLHNFDFCGGVEMGFRFFTEHQGRGYATESALALKDYLFNKVGIRKLKSRCYKENFASARLIERLGLIKCAEDATYYYFEI